MKNLIIASALAVSSILPFAAQSQAASVQRTVTVERIEHRPGDRHMNRRHHRADCFVKKVKTRHHGRVIVKTTRVCR